MGKRSVVIFDDEGSTRRDWQDQLHAVLGFSDAFEVYVTDNPTFEEALDILERRRVAARHNEGIPHTETFFDTADVLIVDYDLFELEGTRTGEEVAYLARCYSECGLIIAVNQFAKEGLTFDLTLKGHPESFADLNLLVDQIFEPGLWRCPWEGFRPWFWPHLPMAVEDFEKRVAEVEQNLDQPILAFLEIPEGVREIFPVRALEFISSKDADAATFRVFVDNSGNALRAKDKAGSDRARARIAAARISKCLERLVLPGQNILVDAAHLLERYPSLYRGESPQQLIGWRDTHELLRPDQAVMDVDKIEWVKDMPARFVKNAWLSRTAWYWPLVSEHEGIPEVADPWVPRPKLAFCEDTSRFASTSEAVEFVAMVDSPFVRRYVSTQHQPGYGPKLQFAL